MNKFYATVTPVWEFSINKRVFDDWAESVLSLLPESWDHNIKHEYGDSVLMLRSEDPSMHTHLRLILGNATFTTEKCTPGIWWHSDGEGSYSGELSFALAG